LLTVPTIFLLEFGAALTVWYFYFGFHLFHRSLTLLHTFSSYWWVGVAQHLIFCVVYCEPLFVFVVIFHLAIVLSIL